MWEILYKHKSTGDINHKIMLDFGDKLSKQADKARPHYRSEIM